jgi:hypothetical protein
MPSGLTRHQGLVGQLGMALTRVPAFLDPEVLGRDLDRALDRPNRVGVHALQPITRQLAQQWPRTFFTP